MAMSGGRWVTKTYKSGNKSTKVVPKGTAIPKGYKTAAQRRSAKNLKKYSAVKG